MDLTAVVAGFAAQYPIVGLIVAALGGLVVIGQVVVVMTPSKNDDAAWEKLKAVPVLGVLMSIVANFAPIQKK